MKKYLFVSLSALMMTCASYSPLFAEAQAAPELKEHYTNTEKNYTITYPSSWKKTNVPRLDVVLFAPPKSPEDNAHASMNIVSEKVGAGITLDQFYSESAANLKTALQDVVVEKTGSADINGIPTKWILYTHVMQNVKFRVLQYFIAHHETVFLLTFSSAVDSFDSYRHDFDEIAKSFKLEKQLPSTAHPLPEKAQAPAPATTPAPVLKKP